ncbi:aminodeoxychorismate synthase component I [Nocardia goodfellowii]|uniref:aminodeoxychorismate synthase n=1 Tax=Nocardia goodfellowii TaxID=882446 RepID=A0ABS4Q895_9NOCA|nr:aminodeoxychorismate synthase component I [Nocardia goodfellowii]MBP2187908.1 para-aminobenzoate synthetase [Nocardia goodfellowii]
MRTLLIDNYDSYTYNLFQLMAAVYGCEPVVYTNDDEALRTIAPGEFDALVISPGPGTPSTPRDIGMSLDLIRRTGLPVLGVCLGHQALAYVAGAEVVRAPAPRHGHLEQIRHSGADLFAGIPQDFTAVRYHSLCVESPLPPELEVTAWSADGVVMGLRHLREPWWGVQFHPESIATEHGARLLENFRALVGADSDGTALGPSDFRAETNAVPALPAARWRVEHRRIDGAVDTERVYRTLFANAAHSFWLDSSRVEPGLSRFSYLGAADGPLGETLTYDVASGVVGVRAAGGATRTEQGSVFEVLDRRLAERALPPTPELPFDCTGGYVGYFGYELKEECGSPNKHVSSYPDALWMSADRLVVVDHEDDSTWVVTMFPDEPRAAGRAGHWLAQTTQRISGWSAAEGTPPRSAVLGFDPEPWLVQSRETYEHNVEQCIDQLHAGESYEICLTTMVEAPFRGDPLELYCRQRRTNPAPHAAYLRFGELHVLCSSPERFLRVSPERVVESKPIKGTAARDHDPHVDLALARELAGSAKTRAENLMIVDLLRNDLGRVCDIGSVSVPGFMRVESYATVHQLVSTIRGRLRPEVSVIAALRACFPGGSMTGAPKLRSIEITDELETQARGIYSGTLGFLAANGTADLNVVIRTAVIHDGLLRAGAGGAVLLDSDAAAEFDEMMLKAESALRSVAPEDVRTDKAGESTYPSGVPA